MFGPLPGNFERCLATDIKIGFKTQPGQAEGKFSKMQVFDRVH